MKRIISAITFMTVIFTVFAGSVSATHYSKQIEYSKALNFISQIDFDFFLSSAELGEDIIVDLEKIRNYTSTKTNYTFDDLNKLIGLASTSDCINFGKKYDYSTLLPVSKSELNDKERAVFNSNPIYGLAVLLDASFANAQEKGRFGKNTMATNGDAFRHALWNALGAYHTSVSYMKRFAAAHENINSDYDLYNIDNQMDLRNNHIGRTMIVGMDLPHNPSNGMLVPVLIAKKIATATKKGALVRYRVRGVWYDVLKFIDSDTTN